MLSVTPTHALRIRDDRSHQIESGGIFAAPMYQNCVR
jgi:hypothetical protein